MAFWVVMIAGLLNYALAGIVLASGFSVAQAIAAFWLPTLIAVLGIMIYERSRTNGG